MSTEQALLDQLKDIHLPAPSEGWGAAIYAWWLPVITALFCLALIYLGRRYYLKTRIRRYALNELIQMQDRFKEHHEQQRLLNELNMLLRRMAIVHYDREKVAHLSGADWLEFLDRSGKTHDFSAGPGQVLSSVYQASPDSFDADALTETVKQWICCQL